MNAATDLDQLMMDALDGALDEHGRQTLQAYFDLHPAEREVFERMRGVDRALSAAPLMAAPANMKQQVMRSVAQSRIAQPVKAAHVLLMVAVGSMLTLLIVLIGLASYTLLSALLPPLDLQFIAAFARGLAEFGSGVLSALIVFTRAAFSQPIAWVVTIGLLAVVTLWLRVMVAVLIPGLRSDVGLLQVLRSNAEV